jgi:hypothetical protein
MPGHIPLQLTKTDATTWLAEPAKHNVVPVRLLVETIDKAPLMGRVLVGVEYMTEVVDLRKRFGAAAKNAAVTGWRDDMWIRVVLEDAADGPRASMCLICVADVECVRCGFARCACLGGDCGRANCPVCDPRPTAKTRATAKRTPKRA